MSPPAPPPSRRWTSQLKVLAFSTNSFHFPRSWTQAIQFFFYLHLADVLFDVNLFLCTRFRLHPFNCPVSFLRWEFLACKCFPWPFAQLPTWRTRYFFPRFSFSTLYRSLCQPQGSGTGFGLPRVFYFPGTLHIWRAFPYPPRGEAPDGRPVTPRGAFFNILSNLLFNHLHIFWRCICRASQNVGVQTTNKFRGAGNFLRS